MPGDGDRLQPRSAFRKVLLTSTDGGFKGRVADCSRMAPAMRVCGHMVRLGITLNASRASAQRLVIALRSLMTSTRLSQECLKCELWTAEGDTTTLHYEEQWAGEDAMRERVRSDAFTRLLEIMEAAARPPDVEFDFVTERRGLEYIESVRTECCPAPVSLNQVNPT
jgi:quinol monooxygenase YgiN